MSIESPITHDEEPDLSEQHNITWAGHFLTQLNELDLKDTPPGYNGTIFQESDKSGAILTLQSKNELGEDITEIFVAGVTSFWDKPNYSLIQYQLLAKTTNEGKTTVEERVNSKNKESTVEYGFVLFEKFIHKF